LERRVSSAASCSSVTPDFMRAMIGIPIWPGRISLSRTSVAGQINVSSPGKPKPGGMTPMICFMLSETKYHFPMTDGSRPNQSCQSLSLITATRLPSSSTGRRPSRGRTPRVAYMSMDGHAIRMRSTRSSTRNVDVPPPKMNSRSMSFERSL
jgi:hypothetical protein